MEVVRNDYLHFYFNYTILLRKKCLDKWLKICYNGHIKIRKDKKMSTRFQDLKWVPAVKKLDESKGYFFGTCAGSVKPEIEGGKLISTAVEGKQTFYLIEKPPQKDDVKFVSKANKIEPEKEKKVRKQAKVKKEKVSKKPAKTKRVPKAKKTIKKKIRRKKK